MSRRFTPALGPFTAAGAVTVIFGLVCYLVGWTLGWVELTVVAAGCGLALILAVPFVLGRVGLEVERNVEPERVTAGEEAKAEVTVRNRRRGLSRPAVVEDHIDSRPIRIEVPALKRDEPRSTSYVLPTAHRGLVTVGPAVLSRRDPLQLMRRDVKHLGPQTLWVHPRHTVLPALPVGFAKDLEGPTSDTSPAGDVAFHTLREYQPGDDYRHIHWMSTARVGIPIVRHFVDNRRPQLLVVIDDRTSSLPCRRETEPDTDEPFDSFDGQPNRTPASLFDGAVEAAASIGVSAIVRQEPVAIWNTAGPIFGSRKPGGVDDLLDRLTTTEPTDTSDPLAATLVGLRSEPRVSAVVLLTGPLPAEDLLPYVAQIRRKARLVIARVWPPGEVTPGRVPGARMVDYDTLAGFLRAWQGLGR